MIRPLLTPCLLALAGCRYFFPAPVPMHELRYDEHPPAPAKCLLVLLPGAGDDDTAFDKQRFVELVRSRHVSADIVAANATIGYYARGTVWDRLAADVLGPARSRGYAQVWLGGISMGGLGALMYARHHPAELAGVVAMAPFLGDQKLIEEIQLAGGLAKWKAPPRADPVTEDNYQRELWRWLQAVTGGAEPGPPLFLGFGRVDRLAPAARLLAQALPPDHVFETGGGHDWDPWREQWTRFLDQSGFAAACSP